MKLGPVKNFYIRGDGNQMILVYEMYVEMTEAEMTPLAADVKKAVDKINSLLKERKQLIAAVRELRAQLARATEAVGIKTDEETDQALAEFHDLMASLPDGIGVLPPAAESAPGTTSTAPAGAVSGADSPSGVAPQKVGGGGGVPQSVERILLTE